jgi:hypothetical protein
METSCKAIIFDGDQLIQALACVVDGKVATYVSGPITTGQHFVAWYIREGFRYIQGSPTYVDALQQEVIKVNQATITEVTKRMRSFRRLVIEPATLEVSGWAQANYISFWLKVIDTFACEMVMVPDWQYSLGCSAEFRHAIDTGVSVLDHTGEAIDLKTGIGMIQEAARHVEELGNGFEFMIELAAKLRRFA